MKSSISLFAVVSALFLFVTQAQAGSEACHDPAQGMTHSSMGGGVQGEIDANGDGVISRAEFNNYHSAQFDQMDGNKDGNLSADELNAGHKMPASNTATSHLDSRFNAADVNRDGGLDRNEAAAMPMLSMYFDEVDANKDGKVTRQEYFDAMPLLHKVKQDKANML